ncbi:DUF2840 domain-containing protein [Mesorhizobium sp.]|uniref:DUF2840 domain-containing protein n=1 Tax=Mesorhizobium sp. TaxID=1871066 RepID=UPI0025D3F6C1|nr:DUF2840 domain-containing protein [Mesorhizobium sp.]
MTGHAARRAPWRSSSDGPAPFTTLVRLTWRQKKIEHWIRFGHKTHEQILDRNRSVVGFAPNTVFAFVRWAANDYGTIVSRMDIVRAVRRGEPFQTLPFVRPGGEILLKVENWPTVERVLRQIDAIEAIGIHPVDVDPDHWRHVHHCLRAGEQPTAYTALRHEAWLMRRRIAP